MIATSSKFSARVFPCKSQKLSKLTSLQTDLHYTFRIDYSNWNDALKLACSSNPSSQLQCPYATRMCEQCYLQHLQNVTMHSRNESCESIFTNYVHLHCSIICEIFCSLWFPRDDLVSWNFQNVYQNFLDFSHFFSVVFIFGSHSESGCLIRYHKVLTNC